MQLVVSIASWPPRIRYVHKCVQSLLHQQLIPDSIEINLSRQEFPGGEMDLPEELREDLENPIVSINWEEGNTHCFRKEIPAVKRHCGEDFILLSVDDDCIYAPLYTVNMVNKLRGYDAYCTQPGVVGNRMAYDGKIFTPDFWEKCSKEVMDVGISDTWAWCYLQYKGAKCRWEADKEIDAMITGNEDAGNVSPNSERIGGYNKENWEASWKTSRTALGMK